MREMTKLRRRVLKPPRQARSCYRNGLSLLMPIWSGRPDTPHYLIKRLALQLIDCVGEEGDVLFGLVLLRANHNSVAEHSLKVGILAASLSNFLGFSKRLSYTIVLSALLHHLGQDSRGGLTQSKGYLSQRGLVSLLLFQDPGALHYQQILTSFQIDLGLQGGGEPVLEFPVRPHPLSLLVGLCNDFIDLLSGRPPHPSPSHQSISQILAKLAKKSGTHYHPALFVALRRLVGFAPVGSGVLLDDGRRALVMRSLSTDHRWSAELLAFSPHIEQIQIDNEGPHKICQIFDMRNVFAKTMKVRTSKTR